MRARALIGPEVDGTPGGIRTHDPGIRKPVLYGRKSLRVGELRTGVVGRQGYTKVGLALMSAPEAFRPNGLMVPPRECVAGFCQRESIWTG